MDEDDLYWETGVPGRKPYRRFFRGWKNAYTNAIWWANAHRNVFIGVYGCQRLRQDGAEAGFKRNVLPDYRTAIVDKVFLDVDCHDETKEDEWHADLKSIKEYLDAEEIRRRWIFTGGGVHCLVAAEGDRKNVDNAIFYIITKVIKNEMVDPTAHDIERMRRLPGSFNKKRGCWVIGIKDADLSLSLHDLRCLAANRQWSTFPEGRYLLHIDEIENTQRPQSYILGNFERQVITMEKEQILHEYGLDWDEDFCPAMQYILSKDSPNNFERLQLLKYIASVIKVPFVSPINPKKTVLNLISNLMTDKAKADHCLDMEEAETVYRRGWKFSPQEVRKLGYCQEDCAKCLEKRNNV